MAYDSIIEVSSPSVAKLIGMKAASKLAAKDASLFSFSQETQEFASKFMGWTTLSSDPPFSIDAIMQFASQQRQAGLRDVLLIGQGGSTQASMTMAAMLQSFGQLDIGFHTMDSLSPQFMQQTLGSIDPATSLFIVASKSGSTLEPMMVYNCIWSYVCSKLGPEAAGKRFVAITDPDSKLQQIAESNGFAAVFPGLPMVGGRFSALSVFGLVPFALMGIDLHQLLDATAQAEAQCSRDETDNPAIKLAGFIRDFNILGDNKLCFNFTNSCRSFGLWLEQLIAESTGKNGRGVLPVTENDLGLIKTRAHDIMAIVYTCPIDTGKDLYGYEQEPMQRLATVIEQVPSIAMSIDSPIDLACHMVVWEYAVSMFCALIEVNPFDQPDVESTKVEVRNILYGRQLEAKLDTVDFLVHCSEGPAIGFDISKILSRISDMPQDLDGALSLLLSSMKRGDFFSINAFLPAYDEPRAQALENIRHEIAKKTGCATCLEIGPRYLHSIGQFQKGGYNRGVVLLLSAFEPDDIMIPGEKFELGYMAVTQARGDFVALGSANRRALHVTLRDSSVETLLEFAKKVSRHIPSQL